MMHTGSSPNLATPMLQPWAKQAQLSTTARPKTTLCAKQSSDHHPTPHAMPHGMRQWLCQIIRVHWVEPFRCGPAPSSSPCAPQYLGQAEEGQPGQQACIVGKYSDSGRQTDSQTDTCPVGNNCLQARRCSACDRICQDTAMAPTPFYGIFCTG